MYDKIKESLKTKPGFYNFCRKAFGPVYHPSSEDDYLGRMSGPVIISLGAGVRELSPQVINVDYQRYPGVALVADITKLPFRNNIANGIIADMVLEHVNSPEQVAAEIRRVLRNNGRGYISAPFLIPYHAAPHDFHRWTRSGLKELFKDFVITREGYRGGPVSGFIWHLQHFLAMLGSFGSTSLYNLFYLFFAITLWPVKYLDIIFRHYPTGEHIATGFYLEIVKTPNN